MEKIYIKNINDIKNYKSHDRLYFKCEICGCESSKEKYVFKTRLLCRKCQKEQTCLDRYGVINIFNRTDIKEKALAGIKSEEADKKRRATNLKKYGNEYQIASKETREKTKNTNQKKYNVDYNFQREDVKAKIAKTKLERYGTENPNIKNLYFYNNEYFDSSYELYFWLHCELHNIKIKRNHKPIKMENGHKCYIDFIVENELVEIKSKYLTNKDDWIYREKAYKANNVRLVFDDEIKIYRKEIENIFGKNYIKQFFKKRRN
ncbi:MAG: hypothetical protein HUJ68_08515 [Clostridia bacterium]|nr:hypothetical protein [Clostridia bacterium]